MFCFAFAILDSSNGMPTFIISKKKTKYVNLPQVKKAMTL